MTEETPSVSRRTVIKAAAWAAPAVAIVAAAPIAAATVEPPPAVEAGGYIDTGRPAGTAAYGYVVGRAPNPTPGGFPPTVDAALPAGSTIVISASVPGLVVTPGPGVESIEDNGDGTFTIIPVPGVTKVEFTVSIPTAGTVSSQLHGPVGGGPWSGNFV